MKMHEIRDETCPITGMYPIPNEATLHSKPKMQHWELQL